ncbi:ABC transporter permease [bacterium]|nr:ABC transporter permease [bacterium]
MFDNYLKIAFRNLVKHKHYSLINIFGLSVGLAVCTLMVMYIQHEFSYDQFHSENNKIYRVVNYLQLDPTSNFARTAPLLAPTLKSDFSEIEASGRLFKFIGNVRSGDRQFQENSFFFADPDIFKIFSFEWIEEKPSAAQERPNTVVLSASAAKKYFGDQNAVGQILMIRDSIPLTVAGVVQDMPTNSHFHFDFLASFATWKAMAPERQLNTWRNNIYYTYIKLHDAAFRYSLEQQLPFFVKKYIDPEGSVQLDLQPLTGIHLNSHLKNELEPNGSLQNTYIFSAIAFFVLLLACINYMNMATARSMHRMKEIGLRKVVGAGRGELIRQYLGESILLCAISFLIALGLVEWVLPYFNSFTGKDLSLQWLSNPVMALIVVLLVMTVGLLAGIYPALYLSGLKPSESLKGRSGLANRSTLGVRKVLIIFQFTAAVALMIGTGVVYQQLQFVRSQNLGFEKEQIVVVPFLWDKLVQDRYETLKKELISESSILSVTATGDIPGRMSTHMSYWTEGMNDDESLGINLLTVDPDFVKTYQSKILAGRDFFNDSQADWKTSFIVNEAAVRQSGWSSAQDAIGKRFAMNEDGRIIGVINDFHFNSLHETIEPLVLAIWPSWNGYVSIRVDMNRASDAVTAIQSIWKKVLPTRPCEYFFLNDDLDRQYRADEKFSATVMIFAAMSVFIACLGLLALASFATQQRTKEIGIRKVLGATVPGIVVEMSKDFMKLVVTANVVAWPIAYYTMSVWLEDFAYRISVGIGIFLLATVVSLALAFITVSALSMRAANANPVSALKYE